MDHVPFPKSPGTNAAGSDSRSRKWNLAPSGASLWWTSTCEPEEKSDLSIDIKSGVIDSPLKKNSRSLDVL